MCLGALKFLLRLTEMLCLRYSSLFFRDVEIEGIIILLNHRISKQSSEVHIYSVCIKVFVRLICLGA